MSEGVDMLERVQRTTALARRLYLHVKHGGAITESDMERLVRGMEDAASTPEAAGRDETGVALIAAERQRQIEIEGWTTAHDDEHIMGEMIGAAITYAGYTLTSVSDNEIDADGLEFWPWDEKWWKLSSEPIRNLVKAGALIAAEIDRLKRVSAPPSGEQAAVSETKD